MVTKTIPDLKELFKQAAEIAEQVPESMREAAFHRALDLLTGVVPGGNTSNQNKNARKRTTKAGDPDSGSNSAVDVLIAAIDSTQHPGVTSALKVLDRALMVLEIALRDHNVDGLSVNEIAKILTDKFRINTTRAALNMALGPATTLVNRIPRGQGFVYRIMGPGESYLAHMREEKQSQPSGGKNRKPKTRKLGHGTAHSEPKEGDDQGYGKTTTALGSNNSTPKSVASRKGSEGINKSAIGPKAAVTALIDSGFFSTGRTGVEVQEYLKKKRGFTIGTDQLRLVLLRLVRDTLLERDENADGMYEYRKPQT